MLGFEVPIIVIDVSLDNVLVYVPLFLVDSIPLLLIEAYDLLKMII